MMQRLTFLTFLFFAFQLPFGKPASADSVFAPLTVPINSCPGATVTGVAGDYPGGGPGPMRMFLGVPYAAAPTGDNRWQPPQAQCWSGDRSAFSFSPTCPQGGAPWENEDCLYLNVFSEKLTRPARPVMVYFHGGALVSGSGSNANVNPIALVKVGTIVVTINYRLGALGFLAHQATDVISTANSGNYGILDQRAALEWVRDNIASFGGDPNNVTIMGQSAGGLSVLTHLVSPGSAGLFHRAIIQSGSLYQQPTALATAESQGATFAGNAGCGSGTPSEIAACLRALPTSTILANQGVLGQSTALLRLDNYVLTDTIRNSLINGAFANVPIMNGSNQDEERFHIALNSSLATGGFCGSQSRLVAVGRDNFTGAVNYHSALIGAFGGTVGPLAESEYPSGQSVLGTNTAYTAARTDRNWACRFLRVNDWIAQNNGKLFAYEFRDRSAPQVWRGPMTLHNGSTFPDGAYHTAEMQYIFPAGPGVCGIPYPGLNQAQQALSATMVKYWTRFAKSGDPNRIALADTPTWYRFKSTGRNIMAMELTGPRRTFAVSFNSQRKCSGFWDVNSQ